MSVNLIFNSEIEISDGVWHPGRLGRNGVVFGVDIAQHDTIVLLSIMNDFL